MELSQGVSALGDSAMSGDDDDFWQELAMHRARLVSAELEDGLSRSVPADGATEDVRMLRPAAFELHRR